MTDDINISISLAKNTITESSPIYTITPASNDYMVSTETYDYTITATTIEYNVAISSYNYIDDYGDIDGGIPTSF